MKGYFLILFFLFFSFRLFCQGDYHEKSSKRNCYLDDNTLKRINFILSFPELCSEFHKLETDKSFIVKSDSVFLTKYLVTFCPKELLCNELFKEGKLTGELFYDMDSTIRDKIFLDLKIRDTLKYCHLFIDGKINSSINYFCHLKKYDKRNIRFFYMCVTTMSYDCPYAPSNVSYLIALRNDKANRLTSLNNFVNNSTEYFIRFLYNQL